MVLEEGFAGTVDHQKVLDQIKHELFLEAKKTRLKLSYFGHIMQRQETLEKTMVLGKAESR